MYNIKNITVENLSELYKYVSDEDIFTYYIGEFEDNSWFKSPFRQEDDPSFRISYHDNKWVYTDFGDDPRPKTAITLVSRLYNLNFNDTLNKIYNDIYLNENTTVKKVKPLKNKNTSSCLIYDNFKDYEFNYWGKALFTLDELKYLNIYSGEIRHNGIVWHRSKYGDPLFIYLFDKDKEVYKGYRPFALKQELKFYAHNIVGHYQGYDLLHDNSDTLIITKSYKDVAVWKKLGYNSIAPHSENMFISPIDILDLQTRYPIIYVNYDNDYTGVNNCIKYTNEYGLGYFNIPKDFKVKDPFEFIMLDPRSNYEQLDYLFKQKLKRDGDIKINGRS